ncbi:hypothetical protein Sfr7A_06930 [Streptomyces xinghaiensis]|uniref:Uncharacterized protein n=1 Tax=Streptomyces xinghaiensis TaxID=1038928 RepID=A0A3M8FAZ1_9ACTN|nr:hypothetical protein Sfr7A_06930 [Streptomyces xinghaiensis]RKM98143.1 hypothetical protein SFRA_006460 [Streptomyces xinghaiensis]RNC75162.1 hypothetical protein DC095_004980 [Streptomyces xinghaiensis]
MVAKNAPPCKAAAIRMISAPRGPSGESSAACQSGAPPGRPAIRGVIVLTVKPFGETLESPRTPPVQHRE